MGIYSTNKLANVAAVDEETASIIAEVEECVADPGFGDIMEAVIQIHENDQRMFDTLIGLDFVSSMNEAVMLEEEATRTNAAADEKKASSIGEKISQIWDAIINAIKKACANIIAKIVALVKGDKKIYETYKPVLTMNNLEGFPGIQDFAFPNAQITDEGLADKELAKGFTGDFLSAVTKAENREDIDRAWEGFDKKVKERQESFSKLGEDSTYFGTKEKLWKPTQEWQLKKMLGVVSGAADTISAIKGKTVAVIGTLKGLKRDAKSATISKKKGGEVESYKMNKLYLAASTTCKLFSKEYKAYTVIAMKQIAACRKAAILCGRYALKKSKNASTDAKADTNTATSEEQNVEESALMWIIGESSDAYVAEMLGY